MSHRYPLANADAVSTSGTGTYTVEMPRPNTRAAVYTLADRVGAVQIYVRAQDGSWNAHGSASNTVIDTMLVMLVDYPVEALRVTFVEGGVGAAVVNMHVVAG